jgi:hypothetical protein
MYNIYFKENQ